MTPDRVHAKIRIRMEETIVLKPSTKESAKALKEMTLRGRYSTKVTATVINTSTKEITTKTIQLSKTLEDEKKLRKAVTKELESLNDGSMLVSIDAKEKVDKLYGLPITTFMEQAIELDPETREVIKAEA